MELEYSEYGEEYERLRTDWERKLWREAVAVLDRNRVERVRHTFSEDYEFERVA
jgi:hypothetical protein